MKIYINGRYYPREKAVISVFDHGLLYGDGVFEGIRIYNGRIFKLDEHLARLFESAKTILLKMPLSLAALTRATVETVRRNGLRDGYIRLIITRGVGNLGLNPFHCKRAQVIIIADRIALYPPAVYTKGMAIITASTQRNMTEATPPQVKSLNYLNNILAKIEAISSGVEEAILLNTYGYVAECTGDNIFFIKNKVVMTPPAYMGTLDGITRATVMELAAQLAYTVKQHITTRHDLYNADECFLTGTGAEVVPVIKIDGRVIGTGKPGRITAKLIAAFRALTQTTGTPVYE